MESCKLFNGHSPAGTKVQEGATENLPIDKQKPQSPTEEAPR
jgi:hypothetical protein